MKKYCNLFHVPIEYPLSREPILYFQPCTHGESPGVTQALAQWPAPTCLALNLISKAKMEATR